MHWGVVNDVNTSWAQTFERALFTNRKVLNAERNVPRGVVWLLAFISICLVLLNSWQAYRQISPDSWKFEYLIPDTVSHHGCRDNRRLSCKITTWKSYYIAVSSTEISNACTVPHWFFDKTCTLFSIIKRLPKWECRKFVAFTYNELQDFRLRDWWSLTLFSTCNSHIRL